ncbi:cupredoxin domain-containing protein [Niveispirillum sp. BGYR6]|uniref:cupredoxin domain-containing protein n=1 Tax=Niveispirillum sp. BGYR6 TaxID=2971249 RepID=UPI0022B94150|nr:cupredoxin domain-containing protein [Niveispirillum sp. BGYR6]MDG5496357.1 cupredoxin domain-containing protein [Niveispirillum sp. BGYR6]
MKAILPGALLALNLFVIPAAFAQHQQHQQAAPAANTDTAIGQPGKAEAASRTIAITLSDMAIDPARIAVQPGETVRFQITNKGQLLHSFVIASPDGHGERQAMMGMMLDHGMVTDTAIVPAMMNMKHDGHAMAHDHTGLVLVEPGKSAELVWRFPQGGVIEAACDMPGHYEAGMVSRLTIGHDGH